MPIINTKNDNNKYVLITGSSFYLHSKITNQITGNQKPYKYSISQNLGVLHNNIETKSLGLNKAIHV